MRPRSLACLSPGSLLSLVAISVLAVPGLASAQPLDASASSQPRRTNLDELGMRVYLTYYGLTRGAIHGAMASYAFPSKERGYTAVLAVVGGVGETVVAHLLLSSEEMTPGRAHVIGTAMDFGLIAGIALDLAKDVEFDWDSAERSKTFFLIPLVLSLGGAIASGVLVDARRLTWGDMELVQMSGLVGGMAGVAVLPDSDASRGVGALLGSGLGLLAGSLLVLERDFSVGHGLLLDLGAVVGGLGAGIPVAAVGSNAQTAVISAGLGAALGMGITYLLLSPYSQPSSPTDAAPLELSLQLAPGSFAARDTRTGRPAPTSLLLQGRF